MKVDTLFHFLSLTLVGFIACSSQPLAQEYSLQGSKKLLVMNANVSDDTLEKLQKKISVDFGEIEFGKAIEIISEKLQVTIKLDPVGLEDAEVSKLTKISPLKMENVKGSSVLNWLLKYFNLHYSVVDDAVFVTSGNNCFPEYRRIYDIRSLLSKDKTGVSTKEQAAEAEALMQLIKTTIEPGEWYENGGRGTVQSFRGLMIIHQSEEIHAEIEKLLTTLDTVLSEQPAK